MTYWDEAPRASLALQRAEALTKPCPYCYAPIGERCTIPKTGVELEHQPAHMARIREG